MIAGSKDHWGPSKQLPSQKHLIWLQQLVNVQLPGTMALEEAEAILRCPETQKIIATIIYEHF